MRNGMIVIECGYYRKTSSRRKEVLERWIESTRKILKHSVTY